MIGLSLKKDLLEFPLVFFSTAINMNVNIGHVELVKSFPVRSIQLQFMAFLTSSSFTANYIFHIQYDLEYDSTVVGYEQLNYH